eukprot:g6744.t1
MGPVGEKAMLSVKARALWPWDVMLPAKPKAITMGLGFLLSDLGRLLFHDQVYAIFFLPISLAIFVVEWSRGSRRAPLPSVSRNAGAEHQKRVEKVASDVKQQSNEGQLFTSRPDRERISSRIVAPRKQKIDTSALKHIVEVDVEKGFVVAEPRLRMVELSHFLLSQGYSVPCVPELDDLTVGGLLMGCGIESTSWKYGMFNEICVAYEIVTAGGEVLKVTEESDKDGAGSKP